MLALLPDFTWVALANIVLLRLFVPRSGRNWWLEAIAFSALVAAAFVPWWGARVAAGLVNFPGMLGFVATAQAAAQADLRVERLLPPTGGHPHSISAVIGGIVSLMLVAATTDASAAQSLRAAAVFTLGFAMLVAAWPAARMRLAESAPVPATPRSWTTALWTGAVALALTGLCGRLA